MSRRIKVSAALLALTLFFILVIVIIRPPDDPFRGGAVADPPFASLTYGVHTALWWDQTWAAIHLDWVRLMVFSHVKQIFPWEALEPRPGEWDFSRADEIVGEVERRGLKLVIRLTDSPVWSHPSVAGDKELTYIDAPPDNLDDFGNYCGTLAGRYAGRIAAYEVWNEPNLAREWGGRPPDAVAYVELLKVCSAAIRAADPEAIIISAGLAPTGTYTAEVTPDDLYFQAMYDAGFQHYVDVVGLHAPGYAAPHIGPDEAEASGSQRFFSFRRVEDLREIMVRNGDGVHQVAILEFGWTTDIEGNNPDYAWYAVDEATQAQYMVEAYQYAADHWRPWVGLMSVIYIADPAWTPDDEEYWWGITTAEGRVRPAYIELANMAKYCGSRVIPARAPDSPEALGLVTVTPCD